VNLLLALPILIPLATAAAALVAYRSRAAQRGLALAGAASHFGTALVLFARVSAGGIEAVQVGGWPAPFGITLVADLLAAILLLVASGMGLAVAVYSLFTIDRERESFGYHPLYHVLLMGISGAFLTGDLFNLYVWFEVMLMASFVLMALGGERAQIEGAIKYVTLNLLSSALFLAGVGLLYGLAGTLNLADLARKLPQAAEPGLLTALATLFLVAFGIKAAVFPLFFWLPASYHTPPTAVSAIFAGLLTKVGVYALIRVFTLLFAHDPGYTHEIILAVAGLTMVTGVLGAAAQGELRRILAFHIVSQIGYMILGLGLFTKAALAGAVFYIVHHIVVKTNLFLVSGVIHRLLGSFELKDLGGLYRARPLVAALFLIPALSLAGLPPLSGFFAKLALVRAGIEGERWAIVAIALGVSLLTLFSMTKIWAEAFLKPLADPIAGSLAANGGGVPAGPRSRAGAGPLLVPVAALAAVTVAVGVAAGPLYALATRTAEQLLDPSAYVRAVLGEPTGGPP